VLNCATYLILSFYFISVLNLVPQRNFASREVWRYVPHVVLKQVKLFTIRKTYGWTVSIKWKEIYFHCLLWYSVQLNGLDVRLLMYIGSVFKICANEWSKK